MELVSIAAIGFAQCVAGTMGSRAANRDGRVYHGVVKFLQHSLFAGAIMSLFAAHESSGVFAVAVYATACTAGNLAGAEISMKIERALRLKT